MEWSKIKRNIGNTFPIVNWIEYLLFRGIMGFVNLFPIKIATWMMRRAGDLMFVILPTRRKVALSNLDIAFGNAKTPAEKKRIALESFRHISVSIAEFFRLPKFIKTAERHITFSGLENTDKAIRLGKGQVLVMSHLGVWEYLSFLSRKEKHHSLVFARAIRNPYVNRWIKYLRELTGLEFIDKDVGPRKVLSELRKNHGIGIVIDQWAGNEGDWVEFFGKKTSTTTLPAVLAKRTGAALLPAYCIRKSPGEYEIISLPLVEIKGDNDSWREETTKELNRLLEEQIKKYPEQWTWTHRRWKNKIHIPNKMRQDAVSK